nr:hypothetical protein [Tanacetum cinerariifolium]
RSLPSSWSQVSLIMRTKLRVDTLSFDDLYNNLIVFESDVKGSAASSSSTHNVVFVSSNNTNSTNEGESCILMPRNQLALTRLKLSALIAKKQGTLLESADQKEIKKAEEEMQETLDTKQDNGMRPAKQDEPKAMVTIDREGVDWTVHAEDDTESYALMAFNSSNSGSDTEVTFCSKESMVTIDREGVDWTVHDEDDIESYALMAFNSSNSGSDTEVKENSKKGQNRIKTGQKREAWRSQEKLEAVTVD